MHAFVAAAQHGAVVALERRLATVTNGRPVLWQPGDRSGHRRQAEVARQVVACRASAAAAWPVMSSTSSSQYPVG